jgi:3-oxoacyl-[acyl-carrier protein] reductase
MQHSEHKRVVIITGASRGLGREIALAFGKAGERVAVNFLSSNRDAALVADEISHAGGEAVPFQADVRQMDEVDMMMNDATMRWGRIDVVVNNAGVTKDGLLFRMTEQNWDTVIDTNLKGAFHCIRSASKIMTKQRQGHIINIASIVGMQGREGQANYSASKAGLIGLTKASARELGRVNIQVNVVMPGYIQTDMGDRVSEHVRDRILQQNTLGRMSDPREVADFVLHLSRMKNVSGQIFNLDSRIV